MTRTTLMTRDLDDLVANRGRKLRVLDVQHPTGGVLRPATWDTAVLMNEHDTKIVVRQHRLTGAVRVKAIPARTIDMHQPEAYEIELMPDIPFYVLTEMMEILK